MITNTWTKEFLDIVVEALSDDPDLTPEQIANDLLQGELRADIKHAQFVIALFINKRYNVVVDKECDVIEITRPLDNKGVVIAIDPEDHNCHVLGYFEH